MAAYPGRRLALDIQRLRMDFDLPSHSGKGQPLSENALHALMDSFLSSKQFQEMVRNAVLDVLRSPEGSDILAKAVKRELMKQR